MEEEETKEIYESIMENTGTQLRIIIDHMVELDKKQRVEWLTAITGALPPEQWDMVMGVLKPELYETAYALLPPLPDAMRNGLSGLPEMADGQMRVLLATVLAIVQNFEGNISTEANDYFTALDDGVLPDSQPPQRSMLLSLEDFQRLLDEGATEALSTLPFMQENDFEVNNTAQAYYQAYWQSIVTIMVNNSGYLIDNLINFYIKVIGVDHPLRERGIFYVPSSQWLDPVVNEINRQTGGHSIGLGIGSGNGSLEHFLHSRYNLEIEATDLNVGSDIWGEDTVGTRPLNWSFPITQLDAVQAVRNNPAANFLVLSWPSSIDNKGQEYGDLMKSLGFDLSVFEGNSQDSINFSAMLGLSDPFHDALIEWGNRGPVLFIGEHIENSMTGSPGLRRYLAENYDVISFREHYQPLPFCQDYPVLYIPKSNQAKAQNDLPEK